MDEQQPGGGRRVCPALPAPTVGGNKKMVKKKFFVHEEVIQVLLEKYPFTPFPWDPEVLEKTMPDPKRREKFLSFIPFAADMKEERDKHEDIVRQYLAQGYAEEEVEVYEDEEEEA